MLFRAFFAFKVTFFNCIISNLLKSTIDILVIFVCHNAMTNDVIFCLTGLIFKTFFLQYLMKINLFLNFNHDLEMSQI